MTSKSVATYEVYGPDDGYLQAHRYHVWQSEGGNTHHSILKMGQYSQNPYVVHAWWENSRPCTMRRLSGLVKATTTNYFGAVPVFDSVDTPAFSDVVPKLLQKWRASSFNLGVTIGEGRESVELIAERLVSLTKAVQALRKRDLGGALRYLSHVPKASRKSAYVGLSVGAFRNAWLELQYGWLPLVRDISALAEMVKLHPREERITARSSNRGGAHPESSFLPPGRLKLFNNDRRLQLIVVVSTQPTMMERLGLTDADSIAWDLVPLSFVADWFSPIGDYLQTLHAVTAMPVISCVQTSSSKKVANVEVLPGDKNLSSDTCLSGNTGSFIFIDMLRSISATLPQAWVASLQTPREVSAKWEPSLMRLANGAALLSTSLRGLR